MKKNIFTICLIAIASIIIFSPRSRKAISEADSFNKLYEMKNILADFKKNN